MRVLRSLLDKVEPLVGPTGRFKQLYPMYEMIDTILFTPGHVTRTASHVRDALDLKRIMITVVIALVPCILMALYNTGYQALFAVTQGAQPLDTWQTTVYRALGFTFAEPTLLRSTVYGALYFLPIIAVVFAAGGTVEALFAVARKHEINEGFLVTGVLLPLTLPPTIPLWQVALGTVFGVVFAKEIFGGTGMNFLNPALTCRAFLFFAYPAYMSGDAPWIAADFIGVDGFTGATYLTQAAATSGALEGADWMAAFVGRIPGSMGETSALACLLGAALLLITKVGSWRTMLGVAVGTFAAASLLNWVGSDTTPMFEVPFHWQVVLGGWAFGTVFMATDPVSSSYTDIGRWAYGFGIGVMVVLIRIVNPAYPEGMMLAILFMNMFAPLIDHFVITANVKRRMARYAS